MCKTISVLLIALVLAACVPQVTQAPESIREFSSSARTIGGPSIWSSACPSLPGSSVDLLFFGRDNICVTIENMGDAVILLYLVGPQNPLYKTVYPIFLKQSLSICSKTDNEVDVSCRLPGYEQCNKDSCLKFRWRIDDASTLN